MSAQYLIVLIAFLLGQLLMTSVNVYDYQKKKDIEYFNSLQIYIKAEIGYFIIGLISVLCVIFILSDFVDLSITRKDLLSIENRSWKQTMQLYFKTTSFALGCFIQYIVFKLKDKGKKAIDKAVEGVG